MSHHVDENICRCLEFLILLMTVSCSLWLTCYAAWIIPLFD